jgi:hypothetical protein
VLDLAALYLLYSDWYTQPGPLSLYCNGPQRSRNCYSTLTNFVKNFNFSVLSIRLADKESGDPPNEVDTSSAKLHLIYWQ